MKKIMFLSLLLLSITACTTRTPLGPCVGVLSQGDPAVNYDYSGWNIAMGIIFSETVVVPLIVVFDDAKCPTSTKKVSK